MSLPIPQSQVIDISNWRFMVATHKLLGLWPPPADNSSPYRRPLYFLVSGIFHLFCTFLYILTMLIQMCLSANISESYIALTELAMLGKCGHFFRRNREFQALVADLFKNPIFALRDHHEKERYEKNLQHYKVIVNSYMSLCLLVIVAGGFSSIFSDPIAISYPAYFPFDYSSSRNHAYYFVFFYQNIGMSLHCMINLTWDCIMPFLMVNLRSQFEILGHRLRLGFTDPKDSLKTRQEIIAGIKHFNALVR